MSLLAIAVAYLLLRTFVFKDDKASTLTVGRLSSTPYTGEKPDLGIEEDDTVDECGCIYKMRLIKGWSTHTDTIRCPACQKKWDEQEQLNG